MEELNAELDRRIDARKQKIRKKRTRIAAACMALVICLGVGAAVTVHFAGNRSGSFGANQTVYSLPADQRDKFVLGSGDYSFKPSDNNKNEDRMLYSGLFAWRGEDGKTYFSIMEEGAVYTFDRGPVDHVLGSANTGMYLGASYEDGWVYMPAVDEVICGAFGYSGVSRYNAASGETECVIVSSDRIRSVLAYDEKLVYAALIEDEVVIKLCDPKNGRIFRLAAFEKPREGEIDYSVRICALGDRLAVLCWGSVYTVTFDGERTLIAENAERLSTDADTIFVFKGVSYGWDNESGFMDVNAETADVFSAAGEKLASFNASSYRLASDASGFTLYGGRLTAVKNGAFIAVDPLDGSEEKLFDTSSDFAYAARLGNDLLVVDELGYDDESRDRTGRVTVVSRNEAQHIGSLPQHLYYSEAETLRYNDIESAKEALLYYADADFSFDFEKLDIVSITGWGSHIYSYKLGDRHEIVQGRMNIEAEYLGRRFTISIEQYPPDDDSDWIVSLAAAIGYGEDIERDILSAEELPYTIQCDDGLLYYDLIEDANGPCGLMGWFEYSDGRFADIDARILRRQDHVSTIFYIESDEVTASDIKDFLKLK